MMQWIKCRLLLMQTGWMNSILKSILPRPLRWKGFRNCSRWFIWYDRLSRQKLALTHRQREKMKQQISPWELQLFRWQGQLSAFADLLPPLPSFSFTSLWQHIDKRIKEELVQNLKLPRKSWFPALLLTKDFKEKSFFFIWWMRLKFMASVQTPWERLETRKTRQGQAPQTIAETFLISNISQSQSPRTQAVCRSLQKRGT